MSPGIASPKGVVDGDTRSNPANGEEGGGPACASRLGIFSGAPALFLAKCSSFQSSGIFPPDFSTISLSFSKTFL